MVFIWGHFQAFPTLISQKPRISFFHKTPHQAIKLCRGAPTTLPCANPFELKTFMHQEFHAIHLGTFVALSNPHISKITNFIFHKTPHQVTYAVVHRQLGHVQNPPNSKLSCTKIFKVFICGHLYTFPTLTSQKLRISFCHKTPHQVIKLCVVHRQPSHVQTPPNSKLSCTKNFMVFIWGYL